MPVNEVQYAKTLHVLGKGCSVPRKPNYNSHVVGVVVDWVDALIGVNVAIVEDINSILVQEGLHGLPHLVVLLV
jgi:hypothetical protein